MVKIGTGTAIEWITTALEAHSNELKSDKINLLLMVERLVKDLQKLQEKLVNMNSIDWNLNKGGEVQFLGVNIDQKCAKIVYLLEKIKLLETLVKIHTDNEKELEKS